MKKVLLLLVIFILCAALLPWIGASEGADIKLSDITEHIYGKGSTEGALFINLRLPRVILALLVGGTLAITGGSFQVLFRNGLVEPYTLGISGGAALGAFFAIVFPALSFSLGPLSSVQLFSIIGAGAALLFVASFAGSGQQHGESGVTRLLLSGVTLGIVSGGAIMFITLMARPTDLVIFQRWMMGGLEAGEWREIASALPFLIPSIGVMLLNARNLNHLSLGDEMALGHGVEVARVRREVFIAGGIAAAAAVSVSGPIGFVGLIVPHAARKICGFDNRLSLPSAFLLGGIMLAVCDTVARILIYPTEIPVGVLTAVIGGPLFIKLILSGKRKS